MNQPCTTNPELWSSVDPDDQARAVAGCHRCPDMEACRVLGEGEVRGIWGGVVRGRTSVPVPPPVVALVCAADGCIQLVDPTGGRRYCTRRCRNRAERARGRARKAAPPPRHRS